MKNQLLFIVLLLSFACQPQVEHSYHHIAVGTYTKKEGHVDGKGEGVYILKMDKQSGGLSITDTIAGIVNPSYLTIQDSELFAVSEVVVQPELRGGSVTQLDMVSKEIISTVDIQGGAPCHIIVKDDRVITANYMGSISILKKKPTLEMIQRVEHSGEYAGPPRQEAAHPHMIYSIDGAQEFLVSDLGMDAVVHYRIENDQAIEVARTITESGAGPRHLTKRNDKVYVLCELSNTIEIYDWKGIGSTMVRIQTVPSFPNINEGTVSNAAIHLHPHKPFLYISNRGINGSTENSISLFHISADGKLEYKNKYDSGGLTPRDFAISPDGRFLLAANQDSDNILVYDIDPDNGTLKKTGHDLQIPTPVCLKFY